MVVVEPDVGSSRGSAAARVGGGQRVAGRGRQDRQGETRRVLPPVAARDALDDADLFFEHDRRSCLPISLGRALLGQEHHGTDRGVAREGQLAPGREDPEPCRVDGVARRQDEHGLGQVEFARDRLHAVRVEPVGIEHDGERIARQRPFR